MPTILVKRGRNGSLPNLSQGELGFTTDTQQLYIGTSSGNKDLTDATMVGGKPSRMYQLKEDFSLETIDKTIVGAINEVNDNCKSVNIWDNANLIHPINQRDSNVYTNLPSAQYGIYSIDRMQLTHGKYTVSTRQLVLTPSGTNLSNSSFFQRWLFSDKDIAVGDTLTLSAKINGKIYSCAGVVPSAFSGVFGKINLDANFHLCIGRWSSSDTLVCGIGNIEGRNGTGTFTLEWFKLEKSAVATEFIPKSYSAELAECMRYFRVMIFGHRGVINTSMQYPTTLVQAVSPDMRIAPSVTNMGGYVSSACSMTAVGSTKNRAYIEFGLLSIYTESYVEVNAILWISADL